MGQCSTREHSTGICDAVLRIVDGTNGVMPVKYAPDRRALPAPLLVVLRELPLVEFLRLGQ